MRSRSSKYRKPCTSSTGETASPSRAMICVASSKQRSMRLARMWKSRSPGVETAWRGPAWISRNGCSSAGRGGPNSLSHASDPIPITQERFASISRKPTARSSAGRSAHNDRTAPRLAAPGFIVTTRKIAARVSVAPPAAGQLASRHLLWGWSMNRTPLRGMSPVKCGNSCYEIRSHITRHRRLRVGLSKGHFSAASLA